MEAAEPQAKDIAEAAAIESNPATWLARAVPGYDQLSNSEKRAIADFCLLWSLFEARCLNANGSVPAILQAVQQVTPRLQPRAVELAGPLAYFRKRYVDANGEFTYRFGRLNPKGAERQPVEAMLQGQAQEPAAVLAGMLIIAYRLRNNLFHGEK